MLAKSITLLFECSIRIRLWQLDNRSGGFVRCENVKPTGSSVGSLFPVSRTFRDPISLSYRVGLDSRLQSYVPAVGWVDCVWLIWRDVDRSCRSRCSRWRIDWTVLLNLGFEMVQAASKPNWSGIATKQAWHGS